MKLYFNNQQQQNKAWIPAPQRQNVNALQHQQQPQPRQGQMTAQVIPPASAPQQAQSQPVTMQLSPQEISFRQQYGFPLTVQPQLQPIPEQQPPQAYNAALTSEDWPLPSGRQSF